MILVSGIYKGFKDRPYDFNSKEGKHFTGVSRKLFIQDLNGSDPEFDTEEVKIKGDVVLSASVGSPISVEVMNIKGTLVFLKEVIITSKK